MRKLAAMICLVAFAIWADFDMEPPPRKEIALSNPLPEMQPMPSAQTPDDETPTTGFLVTGGLITFGAQNTCVGYDACRWPPYSDTPTEPKE
jgi:hypothetical protein